MSRKDLNKCDLSEYGNDTFVGSHKMLVIAAGNTSLKER